MIYECLENFTTWLKDPTSGVNALATVVPKAGPDAVPEEVAIVHAMEFAWSAQRRLPRKKLGDGPILVVMPADADTIVSPPGNPELFADDSVIGLVAAYYTLVPDNGELEESLRHASMVMRCVERSHALYAETPATTRTTREVLLAQCLHVKQLPYPQIDGDELVAAAFAIAWRVTDRWAQLIV